jgi:hypothetical protein
LKTFPRNNADGIAIQFPIDLDTDPKRGKSGAVAICVGIDFGVISSKRRLSDHAARSIA